MIFLSFVKFITTYFLLTKKTTRTTRHPADFKNRFSFLLLFPSSKSRTVLVQILQKSYINLTSIPLQQNTSKDLVF